MSTPGAYLTSTRFQDAAHQEHGLNGWSQVYCQLKPGTYDGQVDTLALAGVTVSRERINLAIHQRTAPPPGQIVFARVLTQDDTWKMNAATVGQDSFAVVRNGEEQSITFSGPSDVLIVAVDEAKLGETPGRGPSAYTAPATEAFTFCATWALSVMAQFATIEAGAATELAAVLPGMIIDRLQHVRAMLRPERSRPSDAANVAAVFRRACAIVEARAGEEPTVLELARLTGVSPEGLRCAFMESVGIGPANWMRSRRLDGARRDLLRAANTGETVTEIASRWGFWHFGRFSATYAEQFGEPPSRTARAGRSEDRVAGGISPRSAPGPVRASGRRPHPAD